MCGGAAALIGLRRSEKWTFVHLVFPFATEKPSKLVPFTAPSVTTLQALVNLRKPTLTFRPNHNPMDPSSSTSPPTLSTEITLTFNYDASALCSVKAYWAAKE